MLDMDGVLCEEPQSQHLVTLNVEFETDYTIEDVKDFHYSVLTPEQHKFIFGKDCWHREDLYDGFPLLPGKKEVIEQLRKIGRVVVCTSPLLGHVQSKYKWLSLIHI